MAKFPDRLSDLDFRRSTKLSNRLTHAKADVSVLEAEWRKMMLEFVDVYGLTQNDKIMTDRRIQRAPLPKPDPKK